MAWISGNRFLTQQEMENNALLVWGYFGNRGWTLHSVCGMLGNMQPESTINPNIWQSLNQGNLSGGYGLVQWTPASKVIDWCTTNSLDYTDGYSQLQRIQWEVDNNQQWIKTSSYPLTFQEFTQSTESPYYLGRAFIKNYERPADQTEANLDRRGKNAEAWWRFLDGTEPPLPPNVKKKSKVWLYAMRSF